MGAAIRLKACHEQDWESYAGERLAIIPLEEPPVQEPLLPASPTDLELMDEIRPEDAPERSVSSLDDIRAGKLDTM